MIEVTAEQARLQGFLWPTGEMNGNETILRRFGSSVPRILPRCSVITMAMADEFIVKNGELAEGAAFMLTVATFLQCWLENTNGTLLCRSGFTLRSFNPVLKRAVLWRERKQAGKEELRFHDLRRTCATLLLLEDVNAKVVTERLGHARIEIGVPHELWTPS